MQVEISTRIFSGKYDNGRINKGEWMINSAIPIIHFYIKMKLKEVF